MQREAERRWMAETGQRKVGLSRLALGDPEPRLG
jgi:hypothetical protein